MFIAYQFIIARKHRNNCWFANWPTYPEGKERRKKTASQWTREHVGGLQDEQISIPTCWTLKVYVEALPGFSQIFSPDGLNSTSLSQGCILENGSRSLWNSEHSTQLWEEGRGWGTSKWLDPAHGSTHGHVPSMTSSNNRHPAIGEWINKLCYFHKRNHIQQKEMYYWNIQQHRLIIQVFCWVKQAKD